MICTEKLPVPPVLGGAIQTYLSGILPYLTKHHNITVLGTNDPSLPDEEMIDGVRYVRIPGKIFELYKEGVMSYLSSNEYDLIHIFNRPKLILPVRQRAPQAKITLSMHNDMFFPEKINPEEARMALQETSRVVTVSDYIGNVIKDLFPEAAHKIQTVYSGVDIDRFLPKNNSSMSKIRNQIRKQHGLENKTVLLFAGRLSRNKGVDKLIRAIPALSKRFDNLALVIMGGNWFSENRVTDYVAYIRALAKRLSIPVITTGFIAADQIQNWFSAADVFVCTSVWQEPLARVHYEAMASGLPIVTTARGGNAEVIIPRENGVVIDNPEDPNEFVEKITEVLRDQSLMNRMSEKGRELAITRYTWDRVASDVLNAWQMAFEQEVSTLSPTESEVTQVAKETTVEKVPNKDFTKTPVEKLPSKDFVIPKSPAEKVPSKDFVKPTMPKEKIREQVVAAQKEEFPSYEDRPISDRKARLREILFSMNENLYSATNAEPTKNVSNLFEKITDRRDLKYKPINRITKEFKEKPENKIKSRISPLRTENRTPSLDEKPLNNLIKQLRQRREKLNKRSSEPTENRINKIKEVKEEKFKKGMKENKSDKRREVLLDILSSLSQK